MRSGMAREYVLDGSKISSLEAFYDQIGHKLAPGADWGRNLDALDDFLGGGFGGPEGDFNLRWANSEISRANLGYPETVRQLQKRLEQCHPSNRDKVRAELTRAENGLGATVFDWLVEIIRRHDAAGDQSHDNIRLLLE